jgi:hypothetical protein
VLPLPRKSNPVDLGAQTGRTISDNTPILDSGPLNISRMRYILILLNIFSGVQYGSKFHVRVDDDVKVQATEAIGGNGIVGV